MWYLHIVFFDSNWEVPVISWDVEQRSCFCIDFSRESYFSKLVALVSWHWVHFNQSLDKAALASGLQNLTIGSPWKLFNMSLDNLTLPRDQVAPAVKYDSLDKSIQEQLRCSPPHEITSTSQLLSRKQIPSWAQCYGLCRCALYQSITACTICISSSLTATGRYL